MLRHEGEDGRPRWRHRTPWSMAEGHADMARVQILLEQLQLSFYLRRDEELFGRDPKKLDAGAGFFILNDPCFCIFFGEDGNWWRCSKETYMINSEFTSGFF